MDIRHRFSRKVRYLRAARRWTQEKLSERAGVTPKYVGQIERGEVSPTLVVLAKLAKAFEIPLHEMLYFENEGHFSGEAFHRELSTAELDQVRSGLAVLSRVFGMPRGASPEQPRVRGAILLVEPSEKDAEAIASVVREHRLGNELVRVHDGSEALEFLFRRGAYARREGGDPILIVLDAKVSRPDGVEVLRKIRRDPALKTVPAILLAAAREHDQLEGQRLVFAAYLTKPFGFEKFARALRDLGYSWTIGKEPSAEAKKAPAKPEGEE